MDVFSRRERSRIMSRIRSHGNAATELRLIGLMRARNITGWRTRQKLPGSPDFVFPQKLLAVFVDGCFWHGCAKHCRIPSSNRGYWRSKIARNKARHKLIATKLRRRGWRVLRIWQHELKHPARCVQKLLSLLGSPAPPCKTATSVVKGKRGVFPHGSRAAPATRSMTNNQSSRLNSQ